MNSRNDHVRTANEALMSGDPSLVQQARTFLEKAIDNARPPLQSLYFYKLMELNNAPLAVIASWRFIDEVLDKDL